MKIAIFSFLIFVFTALQVFFWIPSDVFFLQDLLYLPSVWKDISTDHGNLLDWSFTPAPYFFPDMVLYFLFQTILPFSWSQNAYLISIFQIFFFFGSVYYLFSILLEDKISKGDMKRWDILIVISILFSIYLLIIPIFRPFIVVYLLSEHFGAFWISILCLALVLKKDSKLQFRILLLLIFCITISDRMFFILFVGPVVATSFFVKTFWKRKELILILSSAILALIFYSLLKLKIKIEPTHKAPLLFSVAVFVQNFLNYFFLRDFLFFLLAPVVLNISLAFQFFKKKSKGKLTSHFSETYSFFGIYSLFVVLFSFATPVLFGLYVDEYSFRYCVYGLVLPFLSLGYYILYLKKSSSTLEERYWVFSKDTISLLFSVSIFGLLLYTTPKDFWNIVSSKWNFVPEDTQCLDRNAEIFPTKFGISDYWNSKNHHLFSQKGFQVHQVDYKNLSPAFVLNNKTWYSRDAKYSFIIIDHLPQEKILEKFGKPTRTLDCAGKMIWIYQNPFRVE